MRDISDKIATARAATAKACLRVSSTTIKRIEAKDLPKGDPLAVAKVAAIQAAKSTSQIIPYCHPLPIDFVGVDFKLDKDSITIETTVRVIHKTGVEMEALTAASVAALTIYDMVKMLDDFAEIEKVSLVKKTGGKSDFARHLDAAQEVTATVLVLSDRVSRGVAEDVSGKMIVEKLESLGVRIAEYKVIADDESELIDCLRSWSDESSVDLVITTGGTGLGPRDITPEAVEKVVDRQIPGVSEAIRSYGQTRNPYSMLSRAVCGVKNNTILVSLPGSRGGVKDAMDVLFPYIIHGLDTMKGGDHKIEDDRSSKASSVGAGSES